MATPESIRSPSPDNTLKVLAAAQDESRKMAVFSIPSTEIMNMGNAAMVTIWVDAKAGPICIGHITLRALTSFIPRIAHAVRNHRNNDGAYIKDVLLPEHSINAYKKLLGWIWASIKGGRVAHFKRVTESPAATYQEINNIANDLAIGWLANAMKGRLQDMKGNAIYHELKTVNVIAADQAS